jgi:opacity protein-like surface antigen
LINRSPGAYAIMALSALLPVAMGETSAVSLSVDAGVNLMGDVDVGGTTGELDPGFRVDADLGYRLNSYTGIGFEIGYLFNEVKDARDGETYSQVPILATITFRYEKTSRWVPYIAFGVGGVWGILDSNYDSSDSFAFAWQVEAGLRYKFSDSVSLGLIYKYLGTSDQEFEFADDEGLVTVTASSINNHLIGLGLIWNF